MSQHTALQESTLVDTTMAEDSEDHELEDPGMNEASKALRPELEGMSDKAYATSDAMTLYHVCTTAAFHSPSP